MSRVEDQKQKNSTSVANLQIVIEQIQRDNDRKVAIITQKLEKDIQLERVKNQELQMALRAHEQRVREQEEALGAASRLSECVDAQESRLASLRAEGESNWIEIVFWCACGDALCRGNGPISFGNSGSVT